MVSGGSYSPSEGVRIRNIVYREVFQNHLGNFNASLYDTSDISSMDMSLNDSPKHQSDSRKWKIYQILPLALAFQKHSDYFMRE